MHRKLWQVFDILHTISAKSDSLCINSREGSKMSFVRLGPLVGRGRYFVQFVATVAN